MHVLYSSQYRDIISTDKAKKQKARNQWLITQKRLKKIFAKYMSKASMPENDQFVTDCSESGKTICIVIKDRVRQSFGCLTGCDKFTRGSPMGQPDTLKQLPNWTQLVNLKSVEKLLAELYSTSLWDLMPTNEINGVTFKLFWNNLPVTSVKMSKKIDKFSVHIQFPV